MRHTDTIRVRGAVCTEDPSAPYIEFSRAGGCSACSAAKTCGSRLLPGAFGAAPIHRLSIQLPSHWRSGDEVCAEIPARTLLRLTSLAYLWPAFLMLCGGWLGAATIPPGGDPSTFVGAAAGLLAGCATLAAFSRRDRVPAAAMPRIRIRNTGR